MMARAAVLIGIRRTGDLPTLEAAVPGAKRMRDWALQQGMDDAAVKLITDEAGPVGIREIKQAVNEILALATIEQLLVYFAGHGVNKQYHEYWLLSRAPEDADEAVNLSASDECARYGRIPHVVFFSDACRTAPEGIQAGAISGGTIFPSPPGGTPEQAVDIFYASLLGTPSLEVRSVADSAGTYRGVYTDVLHEALSGEYPSLLVPDPTPPGAARVVRPRPLKHFLRDAVPTRLRALGVPILQSQQPDAHVSSDDDAWVARVEAVAASPIATAVVGAPVPPSLVALSTRMVRSLGRTAPETFDEVARSIEAAPVGAEVSRELFATASGDDTAWGPMRFETACGFKLRGARVAEVDARDDRATVLDADGTIVRVALDDHDGCSVLFGLEDGRGVVLPALGGFVGALTFEDGALVRVDYEPSEGSGRWAEFAIRMAELRRLRNVTASAARYGVFRLEDADAAEFAQQVRLAQGVDPAMAIYAAYAYRDANLRSRIREMSLLLEQDVGVRLFDVEMLAGIPRDGASARRPIVPALPLLGQGWAFLSVSDLRPPRSLDGIERHVLPSLWTLYDASGVTRLREAIRMKELY